MKSWAENKLFYTNRTLNIRGQLIRLDSPQIMAILNVTPDSFYDGGRYDSDTAILTQAEKMMRAGATFIDVGGYSSRPGAIDISVEEEIRRVSKAFQLITKNFPDAILSVDTFRSQVAEAAVQEGAAMVNDIAAGALDPKMFSTVARLRIPYVLMHMRGDPKTMTHLTAYENMLKEVADYFHLKIHQLQTMGVRDIIIDPGFGFAKTRDQSFQLLNSLEYLKVFNTPVLVGLSRKSMIWKTLSISPND